MSDETYYPAHSSLPVERLDVRPPGLRVLVASFIEGAKIPGSERWMWLVETAPRRSFMMTMPEDS